MTLLLKFACNTDLGLKNWLHDPKMTIFCCKTSQKANCACSVFFRKQIKIMLVVSNCDKNDEKERGGGGVRRL